MSEEKKNAIVVQDRGAYADLMDTGRFRQMYSVAKLFAASELVPTTFQNKEANCMVAMQMAFRMNIDPMMFMQNTYIVQGRPGMESKLAIALVNSRGPFTGPIQWRFEGEGKKRKCTAFATHKITGETCEAEVSWEMVEAEGWASKSGSKWRSIPDLMFRYRSAMFLARLYCPEVLLGMYSVDELRDSLEPVPVDVTPRKALSDQVQLKAVEEIAAEVEENSKAVAPPSPEEAAPQPAAEEPPVPSAVQDTPQGQFYAALAERCGGDEEAMQGTLNQMLGNDRHPLSEIHEFTEDAVRILTQRLQNLAEG